METITAVLDDITRQHVDAIVNAANTALRGGGGVDGAIHRAGGPAILAECTTRYPHGLAIGGAGWTTAGELPARWVIHTVGPNYRAGERDRTLLESCYRRSLQVADTLGARTVAFPLIGAGIFGWPRGRGGGGGGLSRSSIWDQPYNLRKGEGIFGWPRAGVLAAAFSSISLAHTAVEHVRMVAVDREIYRDLIAALERTPGRPVG